MEHHLGISDAACTPPIKINIKVVVNVVHEIMDKNLPEIHENFLKRSSLKLKFHDNLFPGNAKK